MVFLVQTFHEVGPFNIGECLGGVELLTRAWNLYNISNGKKLQ